MIAVRMLDSRVTSMGARGAGEIVELPDPEAKEFLREGWAERVTPPAKGVVAPLIATTAGVQIPAPDQVPTASGAANGGANRSLSVSGKSKGRGK